MKVKKFISVTLFLVLATAIFAVPAIAAEEKADPGSAWNIYFRPGVRFGTESRVLYIMDFLIPLYQDEKNIVFSNIKYTPNDHEGWELNVGAGYRRLLWDDQLLLGLNAYYDKRRTDWGTNHEQWGVGLEAMADIPLEAFNLGLTGRFNYYYPLSHTRIDGLGTPYAKYALSDSGIILYGGRVEEPMRGFDYEGGVRIPYISDYVETWAYAGGYHYKGRRVRDINGFMARLEIIPTDFMRLNYEFHHDNYSKAEHYGEVTFEVPFSVGNLVTGKNPFEGFGDVFTGSRELKARMVEPVRRDVDVKVVVDEENGNIPGGGEEIEDVVFVSETGSDVTGDGTMENPYATLSFALASDPRIIAGTCKTIHVMNSSTTAVIADNPTLNISDFLLWGSGANHPKYSNIINMPYAGHPTINDTLVLNADNPTVTGLGFDVTGSDYCINILNGTGVKITNNEFKISNAGRAYGIYSNIGTTIGTEANPIIIAKNSFDVTSTGNNAYGIYSQSDHIFATITGNDMSNGIEGWNEVYGIFLEATRGGGGAGSETSPVIISGNLIPTVKTRTVPGGGEAHGIQINSSNDVFAYITGNDLSDTIEGRGSVFGIRFDLSAGNLGSETRPVIISGNSIDATSTGNEVFGIFILRTGAGASDIYSVITGNKMLNLQSNNAAYGIRLYSFNGSIGSAASPVIISGNLLDVTSNANIAYGTFLHSSGNIFANIKHNYMDVTAATNAYGGNLESGSGIIGDVTSLATSFYKNAGTIIGTNNRYMLILDGTVNGGNYVNWKENSFTPVGGAWSGNYNIGDSLPAPGGPGPVQTNFGAGDTITP